MRPAGWRVRPGDKGGDKFGRLPRYKRESRQAVASRARSSAGCRATENPAKNEVLWKSGTWPLLRTFSAQKRAVTQRDGSCLLFPGVFGRNRANLEAEAPRLPSDKKKRTFRDFGKLTVLSTFQKPKLTG